MCQIHWYNKSMVRSEGTQRSSQHSDDIGVTTMLYGPYSTAPLALDSCSYSLCRLGWCWYRFAAPCRLITSKFPTESNNKWEPSRPFLSTPACQWSGCFTWYFQMIALNVYFYSECIEALQSAIKIAYVVYDPVNVLFMLELLSA